jgi:ribonuclease HI
MGAAFILTEPSGLNIQLAVSTTTWPSAYKAELLAILLPLLVVPNNCQVNLYSDCESIIKHFGYINKGGFNNIRNIFKQPHHNLWLAVLQEINKKNLTIIWHKVNSHSDDSNNNAVDRLARDSAYNQTFIVHSDISHNPTLYLPLWNSRLINVHYRHFIRSLTYLQGLDKWTSLGRFSDYPSDAIDWELTGSLLQPSEPGTSFLASRHKRNLLALMLEELPTLTKLQQQKPHVYDKDWTCCRCNLSEIENFNHLWLCSDSVTVLDNIKSQAKILLQDTIKSFTSDTTNLHRVFENANLWDLPSTNQPNFHVFFSFIDLIKGIIPSSLAIAVKQQGLTTSQVSITFRTLLAYIQTTCWDLIWTPRCDKFRKFLQDHNITPEFQRSTVPPGYLASSPTPTRNVNRSTSDTLIPTSISLVTEYMNY